MPQEKQSSRVRFTYREGPDYRTMHATGARGAVTPQGNIRFDLFTEFPLAPTDEIRNLNQNGTIGDPEESSDGVSGTIDIVRQLQVGVVLSPGDAESLGVWLKEKAEEARSAMKLMQSLQKAS